MWLIKTNKIKIDPKTQKLTKFSCSFHLKKNHQIAKQCQKKPLNEMLFVHHAIFCLTNYLQIFMYGMVKKEC
jgi:hypothetical protein